MLKRRIIRINQNHSREFSTYSNNLLSMLECNTNIEKLIKIPIHPPMMPSAESLRGVVRQLADTFNDPQRRELSYFDFYDKSLTFHDYPPNQTANKEGFKQFIYLLWKAFPDIIITFEVIIIEGNKVACRYNLSGTHKGEFADLLPTDKQFRVNGMTVFSFRDAKVIERWNLVDMKSLIEQLKTHS